jgi:hypothetical protein
MIPLIFSRPLREFFTAKFSSYFKRTFYNSGDLGLVCSGRSRSLISLGKSFGRIKITAKIEFYFESP